MALNLINIYTAEVTTDILNQKISELFATFTGLEEQNISLGGLTITPLTNASDTFNITNSADVSILKIGTDTNNDRITISNSGSGDDIVAPNFTLANGYIAPGGNEALRWDVVAIDVDGTSPDSVGYSIDEMKVVLIESSGHRNGASVSSSDDTASGHGTNVLLESNNIALNYGGDYSNGETVHVFLMYTA